MKKEKIGLGFSSSQNTEFCFLGRQYCSQRTVICNFAVSWANLSYQSQKTPSPEAITQHPKSHRPPKVRSHPNERCQNLVTDERDRADITWKLKEKGIIHGQKEEKKYCDIYGKEGTEGSRWPTVMEQLSEIPRALEMSAQLYLSTHSLPVTSLTTQLDTEQMPPWTLSLLNLSLHFTSTTTSWPIMLGMQTLKPHVCNEETTLLRAWKCNQLIQPRGELTEAGEDPYMPSLLATNSASSKIGRTEHFLLFHAHLLRHSYQPTQRKACKAQRGAELPALGTPWRILSRHGLPHPLKPKCAAKTSEGTNTFQDIAGRLCSFHVPRKMSWTP